MQHSDPNRRSAGTVQGRRVPQPWPKDKDFRILSIDGGGIRGILPAAFLAAMEERYLADGNIADCFDLIVGTSTGGILGLGLASGLNARQLAKLYIERGGEVFTDYSWWRKKCASVAHLFLARCDHRALERLIDEILQDKKFWQANKRLCIPSIDANYGEVFVFKTPHHPDFKKDWKESMARAARATSAAQSFFKPLSDEKYTYLDGGIWANNPVMIGLVDALSCFDVDRHRSRILSLGCVEDRYSLNWMHKVLGGKIFWPTNVIDGSMHLQSLNAIGQAGLLIGRDRLLRVNYPPIEPKLELHEWAECRRILPDKAKELADQYGERASAEFLGSKVDEYQPIHRPDRAP